MHARATRLRNCADFSLINSCVSGSVPWGWVRIAHLSLFTKPHAASRVTRRTAHGRCGSCVAVAAVGVCVSACVGPPWQVESTPKGIEYKGHFCALGVFPIGIDPDAIDQALRKPTVQSRIRELSETFAGRKILLGVDRLDYVKGMPHKLLGLEVGTPE